MNHHLHLGEVNHRNHLVVADTNYLAADTNYLVANSLDQSKMPMVQLAMLAC